jgi:glycosyltransferase involved in cell wall biosynthesis
MASVDAILAERTLTPDMVRHIRGRSDARVVFTFDDAYTKLPGYAGALFYWRGSHRGVKKFKEVLKMTDLNITPSQALNDLYGRNTAPFELVPNFLSPLRWEARPKKIPARDTVVLGGGFSLYHQESFRDSGLADALRQAVRKLDIKIVLYGGDQSTFQSLKARKIPFSYREYVSWYDWPDTLRQEIDIMLAPSAGGYDLYRSTLRLDEAGAARKPFIASVHGPYTGERLGGVYVDNTKRIWYEAIEHLVRDGEFRKTCGERGYEISKERFMNKNVGVYERLLDV